MNFRKPEGWKAARMGMEEDLKVLVESVLSSRCEGQTIELKAAHVILQQECCIDYYQVLVYVSLVLTARMRLLDFARVSANTFPSGFRTTSMIVATTLSTKAWYSARRTDRPTGKRLFGGPEMTTLKDRPSTALLVIDMVPAFVEQTRADDVQVARRSPEPPRRARDALLQGTRQEPERGPR